LCDFDLNQFRTTDFDSDGRFVILMWIKK